MNEQILDRIAGIGRQVRDATCIAPGCLRSAHTCHLDHTIDWPTAAAPATATSAHCVRNITA